MRTRETEIAEDEADIRQQIEPFRAAQLAWMQIPGIDEVTAWALVAEMGSQTDLPVRAITQWNWP